MSRSGPSVTASSTGSELDLELEEVETLGLDVEGPTVDVVGRPVARRAVEDERRLGLAPDDPLGGHLPVGVALDDMLALADGEAPEAVHREGLEQVDRVGTGHAEVGDERPVTDVARLLPGELLVHPARELALTPPGVVVAGGVPHAFDEGSAGRQGV
jgi:hypothetical protein